MGGFTINDRLTVGNLAFDIQTELKNGKVIGEILSGGKVVKRVELAASGNPVEVVQQTHTKLKSFLIEKLKKLGKKSRRSEETAPATGIKLRELVAEITGLLPEQVEGAYFAADGSEIVEGEFLKELVEALEEKLGRYKTKIVNKCKNITITTSSGTVIGVSFGNGTRCAVAVNGVKPGFVRKVTAAVGEKVAEQLSRS